MPALDVRVLGPFEVWRSGARIPLGRSKERDLLALLTSRSPHVVPADVIAEELWQGRPPPSARKVVQKHVSELRQRLGPTHVVTAGGGYALRDVTIDADRFEAAYDAARFAAAPVARDRLGTALASWTGDPYADVELDALAPVRTRLGELRIGAIEALNESRLAVGDHATLIADLERAVMAHPTREAFWSQLMRALAAAGRRADALRAYQRLRTTLAHELGLEPSGELRQLEERLLRQDDAPTAEPVAPPDALDRDESVRRVVTMVAVDLDEPSATDPEQHAQSLRACREQLRGWATAAGGTLESSMGARLLIAFGAPAHEDDADRAVHLAHQIVTAVPSARASVATGWALVQPDAGHGERVVGSVVEVACSALASAPAGTAHVDQSTTSARARPGDAPPFVGRERELAIARGVLARTSAGHGPQAITVRGEPGVGKTRLVAHLQAQSPDDVAWIHVCCAPGASPSAPLAAVVRAHVGLPDSTPPAQWRAAFDGALERLVEDPAEREWLRSHLGPVGPMERAAATPPEAVAERSEIVAAWSMFLTAIAQRHATVVVLDDVHHTDAAFKSMLSDSLHALRRVPLLMICTARLDCPEPTFSCVEADNLTLTLRGLDQAETDELLAHLLSDEPVSEDQHALVRARSGGNPLYAIHFARMLRQPGWSGSVPDSTRSLIAARLDLLAPLERALVFAGAVADAPFPVAQLAAMQGIDQGAATDAVDCLVEKGLLVGAGREAFTFSHGLVRDVANDELVRTRRARLHDAAAAWIEQHAGDRVAFEAMRIANHLAAAASDYEDEGRDTTDLRHRSFRMMITAGERLEGLGAEDVASRLAAAADGDHTPAALAELHGQRAAALARLGRLREAADAAASGSEAARQAGDPALEARLAATTGEIQWLRGETAACVSTLDRALALVTDLPRDRAATQAIATLAFVTALLGRPAEAIGLAERGLALARVHGLPDKEVRCLNARGAALLLQGALEGYNDFMRALARSLEAGLGHESAMAYHNLAELHLQGVGPASNDFMRALARSLEAGLGHESAMAYHNLAELHLQGVGPASSADMNEQGLTLAERRGLTLAAAWLRSNRVQVLFEAGQWDEALALADIVLADEARAGVGQAGTACGIWAARIHVWRGDLPRAARLLETFLPRARRHAVIQQLGPALVVAGLVETASGRPDAGADYATEFCELTEDTRAYRHMEIADVVRLLVAASRPEDAAVAAANDVIPTIRNQCHSLTAEAVLAAAAGAPDAAERFDTAAERWQTYGHPLETELAVVSATALREGGPAGGVEVPPGVSAASVAALCPVPGVATCSRPIRNQPARPSS